MKLALKLATILPHHSNSKYLKALRYQFMTAIHNNDFAPFHNYTHNGWVYNHCATISLSVSHFG